MGPGEGEGRDRDLIQTLAKVSGLFPVNELAVTKHVRPRRTFKLSPPPLGGWKTEKPPIPLSSMFRGGTGVPQRNVVKPQATGSRPETRRSNPPLRCLPPADKR